MSSAPEVQQQVNDRVEEKSAEVMKIYPPLHLVDGLPEPPPASRRHLRRRLMRYRRRNHGTKAYRPSDRKFATKQRADDARQELELDEELSADEADELWELLVSQEEGYFYPPDGESPPESESVFDGAVLLGDGEMPEEFREELPFGFHLENGGGTHSRALERGRLARAAQIEPDWGDPDRWDLGRHEPTYLIVRV